MTSPFTIILGIFLILAGAYLPFSVYKTLKGKIRLRMLLVSMSVEFGMISISVGYYLLAFY